MLPTGEVALGDFKGDLAEASEAATRAQEHRGEFERSRIEMMRGYAEVRDCRREYLLNYFGEEFDDPCGYCDNCEVGVVIEGDKYQEPFPINSRVTHQKWGEGMVQRYEGDKMVVLFDEVGYKTLDVELVIERGLLEVAKLAEDRGVCSAATHGPGLAKQFLSPRAGHPPAASLVGMQTAQGRARVGAQLCHFLGRAGRVASVPEHFTSLAPEGRPPARA